MRLPIAVLLAGSRCPPPPGERGDGRPRRRRARLPRRPRRRGRSADHPGRRRPHRQGARAGNRRAWARAARPTGSVTPAGVTGDARADDPRRRPTPIRFRRSRQLPADRRPRGRQRARSTSPALHALTVNGGPGERLRIEVTPSGRGERRLGDAATTASTLDAGYDRSSGPYTRRRRRRRRRRSSLRHRGPGMTLSRRRRGTIDSTPPLHGVGDPVTIVCGAGRGSLGRRRRDDALGDGCAAHLAGITTTDRLAPRSARAALTARAARLGHAQAASSGESGAFGRRSVARGTFAAGPGAAAPDA